MRIDSHQHFWKFDPVRDHWITDKMSVLRRDFLPEDLIPEMKDHGMDGCIAVQADQSETETRFLLDLASRHPQILGVVGWLDLCSPDIRSSLQAYSNCKKLRGLRHIVQAESDDRFMMRKSFMHGISCLQEFGLTYDILVYENQLPAALEFTTHFPEQSFVIDHIGKPPIRSGERIPWTRCIRELANLKNVYCKISGLITEADWKHWRAEDVIPYLDIVFESFGAYRVMFGSDWPVCLLAGTYQQVVELIQNYLEPLPGTVQASVFGLNAKRFYGV
jgi:L-fuconolactonase